MKKQIKQRIGRKFILFSTVLILFAIQAFTQTREPIKFGTVTLFKEAEDFYTSDYINGESNMDVKSNALNNYLTSKGYKLKGSDTSSDEQKAGAVTLTSNNLILTYENDEKSKVIELTFTHYYHFTTADGVVYMKDRIDQDNYKIFLKVKNKNEIKEADI